MHDPLAVTKPVERYRVTPHGDYGSHRETPADGACGVGKHPCDHPGFDMSVRDQPARFWEVVAPEHALVRYVDRDGESDASPLGGYGPGSMLLDGALDFGHVLGHLDPASIPAYVRPGAIVECGQYVGTIAHGPNHVHWETRWHKLLSGRGAERMHYTVHPLRWLAFRQALAGLAVGVAFVKLPLLLAGALVTGVGVAQRYAVTRGGERAA